MVFILNLNKVLQRINITILRIASFYPCKRKCSFPPHLCSYLTMLMTALQRASFCKKQIQSSFSLHQHDLQFILGFIWLSVLLKEQLMVHWDQGNFLKEPELNDF